MKTQTAISPRRVVVALAILVHNGRVLIGCRPQGVRLAGFWEFPGGKLEGFETPSDCAMRELLEETGLVAETERPLPVIVHHDPDLTVELHPFLCRMSGNHPGPPPPRATANADLRWIRVGELDRYRFPPANDPLLTWLKEFAARETAAP